MSTPPPGSPTGAEGAEPSTARSSSGSQKQGIASQAGNRPLPRSHAGVAFTSRDAHSSSLKPTSPETSTDEGSTESDDAQVGKDEMLPSSSWQDNMRRESAIRAENLREAMSAQLVLKQRLGDPARRPSIEHTNSSRTASLSSVSPIQEETLPAHSPSFDAAFASPLTGSQTASTESTKTIKGSGMPSSPAVWTPKTSSYPFPSMQAGPLIGTPKNMGAYHKPFTALSPTVAPTYSSTAAHLGDASRERWPSAPATPASGATFLPPSGSISKENSEYPSPNLYDLTLTLNSEPGLDSWWANLVEIMRDSYHAERMTLAVPADSTDLENVPWGQRATYSATEEDKDSLSYLPQGSKGVPSSEGGSEWMAGRDSTERTDESDEVTSLHPSQGRPKFETRHSYSSYEAQKRDVSGEAEKDVVGGLRRPGHTRTISYMSPQRGIQPQSSLLNTEALKSHAANERSKSWIHAGLPEMSDLDARGRVFPVLQTLDFEVDPLIDSGGVIRVLERGKVVALSREYTDWSQSVEQKMAKTKKLRGEDKTIWGASEDATRDNAKIEKLNIGTTEKPRRSASTRSILRSARSSKPSHSHTSESSKSSGKSMPRVGHAISPAQVPPYEEYEQPPSSSWSQSPAPSPAIQAEPEDNPFFAGATVNEDSFNPGTTPRDYSKHQHVEAIGVDRASTVIHIPLIHPVSPKNSHSSRLQSEIRTTEPVISKNAQTPLRGSKDARENPSWVSSLKNKTPVAILSILSPIMPYPSNLVQSLTYLAPHLATSFSLSRDFSNLKSEAAGLARRHHGNTHHGVGFGPTTIYTQYLADLADLNDIVQSPSAEDGPHPSVSGSVTSPSEYSRSSPSGSFSGIPGMESLNVGLTHDLRSTGTTPSHNVSTEAIDSYFNLQQRNALNRADSEAVTTTASKLASQSRLPMQAAPGESKLGASSEEQASSRRIIPGGGGPPAEMLPSPFVNSSHKPEEDPITPKRRPKVHLTRASNPALVSQPELSPMNSGQLGSPQSNVTMALPVQKPPGGDKPHSLLHSYGADFNATFQSLPAATALLPRASGPSRTHVRTGSMPLALDGYAMPPPSERLLRTIVDSLPVQIFTAQPQNGAITWVNSRFLTYRGQTVEQFLQNPWQSVHFEEREDHLKQWAQALKNGVQFSHQVRIRRFDGNYRWFFVRAAPLKDNRGVTVHWFGTMMDIHEQHIAEVSAAREKETAASEAKYRSLANSSPQIVFAATETEGITFANTQWLSYSGQKFEQALGLGFMEHVHPEDLIKCKLPSFENEKKMTPNVPTSMPSQPSRKASSFSTDTSDSSGASNITDSTVKAGHPRMSRTSSSNSSSMDMPVTELYELAKTGILKFSTDSDGKPTYSTEVRLKSKIGEYRWHLVRCIVVDSINFGNGEGSWFGTCTDINDHKLLEQKLKETMDSKTRFLSNMSHEIRTPLIGISGMVNFLIDSDLTYEQMDQVDTIRASSSGLMEVINDILDLSKVEAGMMKLLPDWFHVRSMIEEVNDLDSVLAIEKGLELNYVVDEDVPSMVKGDRVRIRQVLLNVIGNAIKFTDEGEVFVHCSVFYDASSTLSDNESMLLFEVVDSGRGFNEKEAEMIFKPFSQIDGSNTRAHGGSGLGLVISRQLVELHGGKMRGTSVPGKGSIFTFSAKFLTPTEDDGPPMPVTPGVLHNTLATQTPSEDLRRPLGWDEKNPLLAQVYTQSPGAIHPIFDADQTSPEMRSSGSSDPSIRSFLTHRSERSSASSYLPEFTTTPPEGAATKLSLPASSRQNWDESTEVHTSESTKSIKGKHHASTSVVLPITGSFSSQMSVPLHPPMYSILVICPQDHSRQAMVKHIEMTLPKQVPCQITSRSNLLDCQKMIGGEDPVIFTHIVVNLREPDEVIALMDQVYQSNVLPKTFLVIVSDLGQKRAVLSQAPGYDYDQLAKEHRIHFIYKPIKPSKFAIVFDPAKERDLSTDRNRDSAQLLVENQKQMFVDLDLSIGNKGYRILLVEDNLVNQKVLLKFLSKVSIQVESVLDGIQCTEKVFEQDHGHYSLILSKCDLQMPNKDGYQTCREIRQWERKNKFPYIPIIALSANVMAEVLENCIAAGFSSYVTKPVDFQQLSKSLTDSLDPENPTKPHKLMRRNRS
ncbi:MAG: hypothetical protein M1827_005319 [Pycnora praestabilis]|nr:MAG: hypothetical protein M1827_005319 [Pycnora praestabilis]